MDRCLRYAHTVMQPATVRSMREHVIFRIVWVPMCIHVQSVVVVQYLWNVGAVMVQVSAHLVAEPVIGHSTGMVWINEILMIF